LLEAPHHLTFEEDSYGYQKTIQQREEEQQRKEILSEEDLISQVFSVGRKER